MGQTLHYQRAHFVTELPTDYLYSPAHAWLAAAGDGLWRVGLTKFATRLLGDMVDHGFEAKPGEAVAPGQIVGWLEGFKAISDLFCVATGEFVRSNPELADRITLINRDPYGEGWLYEVKGTPDTKCVDMHAYATLLDRTIDRLREQQSSLNDGG